MYVFFVRMYACMYVRMSMYMSRKTRRRNRDGLSPLWGRPWDAIHNS